MTTTIPLAAADRHRSDPAGCPRPTVCAFSQRPEKFHNRRSELLEVFRIPGVDGIDLSLESAASNQRVIDRAADYARGRSFLDCGMVLVASERDEREALTNVLQKEHCLLATQAMPA